MPTMSVFQRWTYGPPHRESVRDYVWSAEVVDLGAGAGSIACPSCGVGANYNDAQPYSRMTGCIECKNTGRVLVSV